MKIAKLYISNAAEKLIKCNYLARLAFEEVEKSILNNVTSNRGIFILNNSAKIAMGLFL